MRFFQITESSDEHAWSITVPPSQFTDQKTVWSFSEGRHLAITEAIQIEVGSGLHTDFVLTGFSIPIVSDSFREVVEEVCPDEVQFYPTKGCNLGRMWVMNVLSSVECIDYEQSEIRLCTNNGRAFRKRYGKPEMITRLCIVSSSVQGHKMFRVQDWRTAIVVNNEVKDAIRNSGIKGVGFIEV